MIAALCLLRVREFMDWLEGNAKQPTEPAGMLYRWPRENNRSLCKMLELVWSLFNKKQDLEQATFSSKGASAQCSFFPLTHCGMQRKVSGIPNNDCTGAFAKTCCGSYRLYHPAFPHHLILLRQSARAVKHELREDLLCFSSFGKLLGVFPKRLFIVRCFLSPAFLDDWILSMCWEILQDDTEEREMVASPRRERPVMW